MSKGAQNLTVGNVLDEFIAKVTAVRKSSEGEVKVDLEPVMRFAPKKQSVDINKGDLVAVCIGRVEQKASNTSNASKAMGDVVRHG